MAGKKRLFTFVLLLFGEFECCLLPYGRRFTSPFLSTARKCDKIRIDLNRSWEVKADSHIFLICIGRETKHVFGWCIYH